MDHFKMTPRRIAAVKLSFQRYPALSQAVVVQYDKAIAIYDTISYFLCFACPSVRFCRTWQNYDAYGV